MKTMILAAAAVLALGAGSALAADGGEGGTAVQAQWDLANGVRSGLVQQEYGSPATLRALTQQQAHTAPLRSSMLQQGAAWNSNG